MKFKLDENIGRRGIDLLVDAGHDVMTVNQQGVSGISDDALFDLCAREGRALITLDHDFGQVLRFPPQNAAGVVVLEPGPRVTRDSLPNRLRELLAVLRTRPLGGELWIIEPGRVRIHLDERASD